MLLLLFLDRATSRRLREATLIPNRHPVRLRGGRRDGPTRDLRYTAAGCAGVLRVGGFPQRAGMSAADKDPTFAPAARKQGPGRDSRWRRTRRPDDPMGS